MHFGQKTMWELSGIGTAADIPDEAVITFRFDDGCKLEVKRLDGKLIITSSDRLEIQPRAANQIWITVLRNAPA